MKTSTSTLTLILIGFIIYFGFKSSMPSDAISEAVNTNQFDTERALAHVEKMASKPHAVGFPAHKEVQNYIRRELKKLGLKTSLQEGYTTGDWANLSKAENIVAKIEGTEKGKALLLLSHYDSNPHSSFGASDAGSGVATILEGVRAFLSENKKPKNDIIILLSDAEELGLNGADLFVNNHPWSKDVGLVLNFEARGSGGPSYMLIETNRGNSTLIKEFTKANPDYPVANSLVYSIYKMLPNDTDLTIFREDGDIEGLNFAFIDDHYDYHTAKDTYERLDKKTLAHQGSYLMPLLHHFSEANLTNLKSLSDYNYFNVPFFKLVSYPFDWVWPLFFIALLLFTVLTIYGFKKKSLDLKNSFLSFVPLLITILINGIVGYFSWTVLKSIYPQYQDILHGFTYNGYTYITAFVLFSLAVCFFVYHKFRKINTAAILVGPLVFWLALCAGLTAYLPGANFFIIPVYALLAAYLILIHQEKPNALLLVFLIIPALWIFTPFIKMFPVGLGLKMMVASTLLTTLVFALGLPLFSFYKHKNRIALVMSLLFIIAMVSAHFNSGFSEENANPTSLVYVYNSDKNTAQWATYDHVLSDWTAQFIGADKEEATTLDKNTISSKYRTAFTYVAKAPTKNILGPKIEKIRDTIIGNERLVKICITPQRNVNRLDIFTPQTNIIKASVNSVPLSDYFLKERTAGKLVTHYISNNTYTELSLTVPVGEKFEFEIYEASNDLLNNALFTIPARPKTAIPKPFVLNDAILVTKTIHIE
ncbi:M28 family peptidase [Cellulophaga sp. E6(2014)]|uniref:M28 family peptidase n=1 Tax=Cellulophaga sp. E6(2014) TaxID=1495334 RepID=UPI00051DD81C|nr:M28 family peptidase [Cellulophaga sp. E6(2014)]KGK32096.1 peptidase M28 [Cellulophaga sp. E6(2014)]